MEDFDLKNKFDSHIPEINLTNCMSRNRKHVSCLSTKQLYSI